MELYLGSNKIEVNIGGVLYEVYAYNGPNKIQMISQDNYLIVDSNGVYLLPSDSD